MTELIRLCAIVLAVVFCTAAIKRHVPELALALGLMACMLLVFRNADRFSELLQIVDLLRETAQISPAVLTPVIKVVGISIVTQLTAQLCRDAGEGALASFSELAGTVSALVAILPLVTGVLSMVTGLL